MQQTTTTINIPPYIVAAIKQSHIYKGATTLLKINILRHGIRL